MRPPSQTQASSGPRADRPDREGSRHDRRRARTRDRLAAAGRVLIARKGVADLRITDVTEEADVALGSFYNHFASKDELVNAVVARTLEDLAGGIVDAAPEGRDPAITVCVANRRFVRLAYEDPEFARLLVHLHDATSVFEEATHPFGRVALARGVATGRFELSDADATLVVVVAGALAVMRAILDGRLGPRADEAHAETALRAVGIARDEARAMATTPLDELEAGS